jgi:hypothetical protein
MGMWKPFRLATAANALQAAILFDKFRVMRHLGGAIIGELRGATGATSRAKNTDGCSARRT